MRSSFGHSRHDKMVMGTAFDIGLFFCAISLVFMVALLPGTDLASGVAPGEPVVWYSFLLSGPVALVWIGVFLRRWRNTVNNNEDDELPSELSAVYSLINGLVVIGIGGWLIYAALNAHLDRGQPQTHYAYVFDKSVDERGRFEDFQLFLSDWKHENGTLIMSVASDLYERIDVQDSCLRLIVRPGAFGHEWIVENEPYKRSDAGTEKDWAYQCRATWEQKARLVDSARHGSGAR